MKICIQTITSWLCVLIFLMVFPMQVAAKRLKEGEVFPTIPLKSISQQLYQLTELRGKVVVYDVGASWAKGQDKALVYYTDLMRTLKKEGLRVVIINIDEDVEIALEHTKKIKKVAPVLHDRNKEFVRKLDPIGFPVVYIVDRKGVIKDIIRDYCENEFDLLKERILKVLNNKMI
ncbi:MAG: TlpA family protein disulfide reductase [Bdellovibrionales bacterium]|nr:TlpA family protein disulfide reductase [Bdellovibrionales bacterium]